MPVCRPVTREECKTVPREKCSEVTTEPDQAQRCSINTRLVCEDQPRQKCGNKVNTRLLSYNQPEHPVTCLLLQVVTSCRKVPQQKCSDVKKETCEMQCDTVYWCKMCEGKLAKI